MPTARLAWRAAVQHYGRVFGSCGLQGRALRVYCGTAGCGTASCMQYVPHCTMRMHCLYLSTQSNLHVMWSAVPLLARLGLMYRLCCWHCRAPQPLTPATPAAIHTVYCHSGSSTSGRNQHKTGDQSSSKFPGFIGIAMCKARGLHAFVEGADGRLFV